MDGKRNMKQYDRNKMRRVKMEAGWKEANDGISELQNIRGHSRVRRECEG